MSTSEALTRRNFFEIAGILVFILVAINVGVALLARNTIPRQVARRIDQASPLNCIALGNSLVQAGFDEKSYEQVWAMSGLKITAVNAGLGSSTPIEHLMLLRHAYLTHKRIDRLFYGYFDFQLTSLPASQPGDLVGNRAMLYYLEPSSVPQYFNWSLRERLSFGFMRLFPAIEERSVIWEKVELLRRRMGAAGMPAVRTNRFGVLDDFAQLEAKNGAIFSRECARQTERKQGLARPITDLLALAKEHGTRVVIVEMPMSITHRERYYAHPEWPVYAAYVRQMLEAGGASYVKADDWLPTDDDFLDHVHANPHGASSFSKRLADLDLQLSQRSRATETPSE